MLGGKARAAMPKTDFVLPDFLRDDAFALRMDGGELAIPKRESTERFKAERATFHKKCALCAVAVAVLTLLSLCISIDGAGTGGYKLYAPWDALYSLVMWAAYSISSAWGLGLFGDADLITVAPLHMQVTARAGMTLATLACGALLAIAGSLYQTVFRNPIASPSLLGITNGVKVGLLLMFMAYGTTSQLLVGQRFLYGYVAGIVTLVAVFALSKLITRRGQGISVFDMLVIGTIASSFLSALSKYILNMLASVDMWTIFFEFQEGLYLYRDPITYAVLAVSVAVALIPVILMRFRLNLLSFSDGEVHVMGASPAMLRALCIIGGSLMILTAQVFVGPASALALVIPSVARKLFGSEFGKQLWGNVVIGMALLLLCRDLCALIPFVGVGIPIGTIAGIITVPIFIWVTLFAGRQWR